MTHKYGMKKVIFLGRCGEGNVQTKGGLWITIRQTKGVYWCSVAMCPCPFTELIAANETFLLDIFLFQFLDVVMYLVSLCQTAKVCTSRNKSNYKYNDRHWRVLGGNYARVCIACRGNCLLEVTSSCKVKSIGFLDAWKVRLLLAVSHICITLVCYSLSCVE